MDISFELLSSMSPKINKRQKPIKKAPTILALKKYFRKSIDVSNENNSKLNESVITVESSSVCSSLSEERSECSNETPIIVSDSENSFNNDKTPPRNSPVKILNRRNNILTPDKPERLSQDKFTNIKLWVNEVNSIKQNLSLFSDISTVCGDENPYLKKPNTNIAASSTLVESDLKRFDELFKKNESSAGSASISSSQDYKKNKSGASKNLLSKDSTDLGNLLIKDILITEDLDTPNNLTDDSFELNLNESLGSRLQNIHLKETPEPTGSLLNNDACDSVECEDLLDSLYGTNWRKKKEDILPSSEPRFKKTVKKLDKKVPNTERHANKISNFYKDSNGHNEKNDSNLLKILQKARFQKALESPWTKTLKNICDSDTESDNCEENRFPPIKLDFQEDEASDVENKSPTLQSCGPVYQTTHKNVQNKIIEPKVKITKNKKLLKENHKNVVPPKVYTYSFLASLSGSAPREKCDVSALIYKDSFKLHKEPLTRKLFELYNEKIFDSAISKDTPIEWSDRMTGTAGYCYCRKITRRTGAIERAVRIVLSNKVVDSADRLRDTLVHEMCHAATWIVNQVADGHGNFWKSWACRAMKIFPELPPIKICHDYVINTKYTYKCTDCGYSIGRHTKSLDTNRKRCGYCFGAFEVLLNKTSKKGETKSVPVTPKKPTAFALFVKENYATTKTPDLKHAEVMKILGQKFSLLKVDQS